MSYPDPPQQPRWQPPRQPGQPGQGFPPQQPHGQPHFAPPQHPGQPYAGGPSAPAGPGPGGPAFPGGPGQPPYGGQYPGGQHPGNPGPPSGSGRGWLIPAAAGVALTVMAGTVWATVSLVGFGGPQPESVLPGNATAFAKVDLDINGSQVIDLLRFVDKLPDEITEKTGEPEEDTTAVFAEMFADSYDLDEDEVEEWIGQKAGAAVWPAADPEAADRDGLAHAIALAAADSGAARAQFTELRESHGLHHEIVDDFVVFTDSEAGLREYNDRISAHGDLESSSAYSADMRDVPNGSIALAWADLASLADVTGFGNEFTGGGPGATGDVQGRMTASLRVDGDYLEARMDVFDVQVEDEDLSWLADAPGASVAAMGDLPGNTVVAFGGSGMDEALRTAWEEDELPLLDADDRREMESELNFIGAPLPDGFTSLLGTSTAFGLTDFDPDAFFGPSYRSNDEVSFEYRAVGGDESALNGFIDEIVVGPYSTTAPPRVTADGETVVVSNGSGSSDSLGDDAVFQQTMRNMDDAVIAGYFDLRQALSGADVADPRQWGAVGLGLSVSDNGERATVELRWAPSGG